MENISIIKYRNITKSLTKKQKKLNSLIINRISDSLTHPNISESFFDDDLFQNNTQNNKNIGKPFE